MNKILKKFRLIFHTVRYLRWEQVFYRVYYRLRRSAPPVWNGDKVALADHLAQFQTELWRPAQLTGERRITLLNETGEIGQPSDWTNSGKSRLWLYNLHYFDELNTVGNEQRLELHAELIERWIQENPPGQGIGWGAYPTSLRIVNWLKWFARHPERVKPSWVESLALQTDHVSRNLEQQLLGNHLFANIKALLFSSFFLKTDRIRTWMKQAVPLFQRELKEQYLSDGGHFERSPMYNAILLEDLIDLLQAFRISAVPLPEDVLVDLERRILAGLHWQGTMIHPDGDISLFNDAAMGIAPSLDSLNRNAALAGVDVKRLDDLPDLPVEILQPSGFARIENEAAVVLIDAAPIEPLYLPAHAHASTLSFELSIAGKRLVVNSGTSTYDPGDRERAYERSTAAHSTVEIDGRNSSEIWSGFRVARRAKIVKAEGKRGEESAQFLAAHDGYRRLYGSALHERSWVLRPCVLTVTDQLTGRFEEAVAHFHLHPDVTVQLTNDRSVLLTSDGMPDVSVKLEGGSVRVEEAAWRPGYNQHQPAKTLAVTFNGSQLTTIFSWHSIN